MIPLRKKAAYRGMAILLVFLFLFPADSLPARGEDLDIQLVKAKDEYRAQHYDKAAKRLERLTAHFGNIRHLTPDIESRYGQTLLLLAACRENLKQAQAAEAHYRRAREMLGKKKHFTVPGINLKKLELYKKIRKQKQKKGVLKAGEQFVRKDQGNEVVTTPEEKKQDGKIIAKQGVKKKKKKIPWLIIIAGGAVVVGVVLLLLMSKKSKKTLTVVMSEGVTGRPAAGTHRYKKGEEVSYGYSLESTYSNLTVTLDGQTVASSGTVVMDGDHELRVSAAATGSIRVNSNPTGARVYLDGGDTGRTTNTVLTGIHPGSRHIKLTRTGYRIAQGSVTVEAGREVNAAFTLTADALASALDTYGTFVTSGRRDWVRVTNISYYGGDSAQSPGIGDGRTASFETVISGVTTVKFYWKVSSEPTFDYLEFFIDGVSREKISGNVGWHQKIYTVSTAAHTLKWLYVKDNSVSVGDDSGWVDKLELLQ